MSKKELPVVPLRDIVLFPGAIIPLFVGREKSIKALSAAQDVYKVESMIFTAQKSQDVNEPAPNDIFEIGVIAKILQAIKLSNNNIKLLVEAKQRVKISNIIENDYLMAEYEVLDDEEYAKTDQINIMTDDLVEVFKKYAKNSRKVSLEVINAISSQKKNPAYLSNIIASHLVCKTDKKQKILEIPNVPQRIEELITLISSELAIIDAYTNVSNRVKQQIEKTQKDYYLHEQMKAIQKELGDDDKAELAEIEKKIQTLPLSKEAREKAQQEFKKLKGMNSMTSEASVLRSYLDILLEMPWGKFDKAKVNVKQAAAILERDHYGLEKVKERILDYLAVLQRSKNMSSPIICFVGPPGVGKTSLARSIAEAVGRQYTKFSLGGIKDEAEIRGHRKTYIGSMPGKIVKQLRRVKVNNPLMLLDEIDKIGADFRGDPSSAMLEVLDPEQNKGFVDHYLDVEYDLSNIMFIATANSTNIARPLLDRMEIIRIEGYVEEEKFQIAQKYLIPKQLKAHNMKASEFIIADSALLDLIRYYTRESGVRNLEREIATLARKSLRRILSDKEVKSITITSNNIEEFLGPQKFRYGLAEEKDIVGSTTGLAYTEVGGDLLSIEAVSIPGKGEIKATGKLGDVMKESTQAAYSFFCSHVNSFVVPDKDWQHKDIHLHVPEGATPKDGPSAGVAIFTTIVSLMTGVPVRKDVAMTGEITLRGNVLPIGGLKEKLLAASRGGIKTVIIPQDNMKDLKDIPPGIKQKLQIVPVSKALEVLDIALNGKFYSDVKIH